MANIQKSRGPSPLQKAIRRIMGNLPDADVKKIEEETGLLLGDLNMEVHFRAEANLLSAIIARAELLDKRREPMNLDSLLGKPGRPTKDNLVRGRIKQLIAVWKERGAQPGMTLVFLLPEGHPMIPVVQKIVAEGFPKVYAEEYLGEGKPPALPRFSFKWIGLSAGQTKSHSPLLIARAKERSAPEQKPGA